MRKRIAVVGSGISGLSAAHLLSEAHDVTLFEAADRPGGHTATVDVTVQGQTYAVDTGFIVFNERTYPNFLRLLAKTGVRFKPTSMSFSVHHDRSGIEYSTRTLSSVFAQRLNLLRPRWYLFLRDIPRFNARALAYRDSQKSDITLGQFLEAEGFSEFFAQHYILPMVAAIWSSSLNDALDFPLDFFIRFFDNHGLLSINDMPQWYVIEGGSRSYIPALLAPVQNIRLGTPVRSVARLDTGVMLQLDSGYEKFDELVLACHSDQALALLADPSMEEEQVLGALPYRMNEVVLHTDIRLLPANRRAWGSWNYWVHEDPSSQPSLTYNMSSLQGIKSPEIFCVTLNQTEAIDPARVLGIYHYAHPVFSLPGMVARARRHEICGVRHTHFAGAYWYNGFHEDGLNSALDVCQRMGVSL
jgi:predicted NAD/FAD-binding protein